MLAALEEAEHILIDNQELDILVDLRKDSSIKFMTSDAKKLGKAFAEQHELFLGRKYVNVVSSQLGFGITRQWGTFLGNEVLSTPHFQ